MDKKTELMTTKDIVMSILKQDKRARNSDSYLYLKVLDAVDVKKKMGIHGIPLGQFLLHRADWGFPPFETVRRARQLIQRKFPELDACDEVQGFRDENETVHREFARGVS